MTEQQLSHDKPMIERVYDILEEAKQPRNFYELADQIVGNELSDEERVEALARLFTDMNLDGRFLNIGENSWGLTSWYPIEQREDVALHLTSKKKKKKQEDDDFDDYDVLDEDLDEIDEDFDEEDFDEEDFDEYADYDDDDDDKDVDHDLVEDEDEDYAEDNEEEGK
ncbi:DNA-directed RNA polymerase subunit delta [Scopulibacillus daqui]|uniref:Probable DNA-directed RNA polymerase subunit delta n=1 Tax=Scopulibacillus daqui TaxID=1469162 RepID=A0ABS2Q0M9_9BACL|nr:DNA-directed RNA polymerase subunit delta [Scopulibacillus daqui]MBM7645390.1 DNA-directed RNA polymerase subunit delta [Scopulibacillus daqui]